MSDDCSVRPGHDTVGRADAPGFPVRPPCQRASADGTCPVRNLLAFVGEADAGRGMNVGRNHVVRASTMRLIEHDCARGGRIDDACARDIRRFLASGGAIASADGLELLLDLLELAPKVSTDLFVLAFDQLKLALAEGRGIYCWLRPIEARGVAECDMHFVERILAAAVKQGREHFSPAERRVLGAIDRTAERDLHHPAWNLLVRLARLEREGSGSAEDKRWWLRMAASATADELVPA